MPTVCFQEFKLVGRGSSWSGQSLSESGLIMPLPTKKSRKLIDHAEGTVFFTFNVKFLDMIIAKIFWSCSFLFLPATVMSKRCLSSFLRLAF